MCRTTLKYGIPVLVWLVISLITKAVNYIHQFSMLPDLHYNELHMWLLVYVTNSNQFHGAQDRDDILIVLQQIMPKTSSFVQGEH